METVAFSQPWNPHPLAGCVGVASWDRKGLSGEGRKGAPGLLLPGVGLPRNLPLHSAGDDLAGGTCRAVRIGRRQYLDIRDVDRFIFSRAPFFRGMRHRADPPEAPDEPPGPPPGCMGPIPHVSWKKNKKTHLLLTL